MNQLNSMYNGPFKDLNSHPIYTCFPIIPSNDIFNVHLIVIIHSNC